MYLRKNKKNKPNIRATKQWKTTPSKSIAHIQLQKLETVATLEISLLLLGYFLRYCERDGKRVLRLYRYGSQILGTI